MVGHPSCCWALGVDSLLTHLELPVHTDVLNDPSQVPQCLVSWCPLWTDTVLSSLNLVLSSLNEAWAGYSDLRVTCDRPYSQTVFLVGHGVCWIVYTPVKASVLPVYISGAWCLLTCCCEVVHMVSLVVSGCQKRSCWWSTKTTLLTTVWLTGLNKHLHNEWTTEPGHCVQPQSFM